MTTRPCSRPVLDRVRAWFLSYALHVLGMTLTVLPAMFEIGVDWPLPRAIYLAYAAFGAALLWLCSAGPVASGAAVVSGGIAVPGGPPSVFGIGTAMSLRVPLARSSLFTLLALAALSVTACDDSEGGAQDAAVSDASSSSPEGRAQDAAVSDASHTKADASQTDASSSSSPGIGTVCEETPCPDGLSCQRPSVCPGFSCDEICVRPTESCISDPCGEASWCQTTLGSEVGTCQPRAALAATAACLPVGTRHQHLRRRVFCSAESATRNTVCRCGCRCHVPFLWLGTDRQACMEGYTCVSTLGGDAKCVPVKQNGETCLDHTDCAAGLKCQAQKCAEGKPGSAVRLR